MTDSANPNTATPVSPTPPLFGGLAPVTNQVDNQPASLPVVEAGPVVPATDAVPDTEVSPGMVSYNEEQDWDNNDPALVQAAEEAQALNAPIEATQAPIMPASNADAPALAVGGDTPASVVQAEMGVIPATRSNLDDLSVEELDRQQREIQARIEAKRAGEKKAVLDQIVTVVTQYGLTVAEVVEALGGMKTKRKGSPAAIKYRDPSNPAHTWSGRGKEPTWIKGQDRSRFLITA